MIKKKNLPEDDKKTWENYIKSPSDIYDKEIENNNNNLENKRLKFDLH